MPVFQIERNGETFEVEAPDEDTAVAALGAPEPPLPRRKPFNEAESAAAGFVNTIMPFGLGENVAGAGEYIGSRGEPGSFERGKYRYNETQAHADASNPPAYAAGGLLPYAFPAGAATGAGVAATSRLLARVPGVPQIMRLFGIPGAQAVEALSTLGRTVKDVPKAAQRSSPVGEAMRGGNTYNYYAAGGRSPTAKTGSRYGSSSPHEKIQTVEDALRANARAREHLSGQAYNKRYGRESNAFRRAESYRQRMRGEQDYPEQY